jgi:hypothetical protein
VERTRNERDCNGATQTDRPSAGVAVIDQELADQLPAKAQAEGAD